MADGDLASVLGTPELTPPPTVAPAPQAGPSNNPLNLRPLPKGAWPGQTGVAGGFASFDSPQSGWTAGEQNLLAKINEHGAKSLADIIGNPTYGWAPASDNNNPTAYAARVAKEVGVAPGDDISRRVLTDPQFRHSVLGSMAGVETGKPQIFGGGASPQLADLILTPQERAEWEAEGGPHAGTYVDPKTGKLVSQPGAAPQGQSDAIKFLTLHGAYDENAPLGSIHHPEGQQEGKGPPSEPGHWYVTPQGQIRQVGDPTPDYLPVFRQSIANNNPVGAIASPLFQGTAMDTLRSANRLGLGSAFSTDPAMQALGQLQGAPSQQQSRAATENMLANQEKQYQISQIANPNAPALRFAGQAIPATLAAAAVPEADVGAGAGLLARTIPRVATNALRGVAANLPNVGANPNVSLPTQLGTSAALGVITPAVTERAGALGARLAGVSTQVPQEVADLADKAMNKYGIPLRGSQIAGTVNPSIAVKDSNLLSAPGSGFAANNAAQHQAFTRAVAGTFGADSNKITPAVMSAARKNLGAKFDAFAASHSIPDTTDLHGNLDAALGDARQVLPASEVAPLENQVENIKALSAQQNGSLSGDAYQALTRTGAPLDRAMQSRDSNIRFYAGKIHDALSDAMAQNATPEELADFANTRLQYKNLMTVKGLAAKADITGAISPTQLAGVVNRSFDDRAFSGAGPLGELADIGQTFMKQPPNSFTAQRAAEIASRNWLPAALGAAAGAEGVTHFGSSLVHDPGLALQLAAGAGVAKGAGYGVNALSGLRHGPLGAQMLLGRSTTPGTVQNALGGLGTVRRKIEIPLSALAGARLNPVGANAQ